MNLRQCSTSSVCPHAHAFGGRRVLAASRRPLRVNANQTGQYPPPAPPPPPPPPPPPGKNGEPKDQPLTGFTKALISASFLLGLGSGVVFDYEMSAAPTSVTSTDILDARTPSQEVCMAYGYSAMTLDQQMFVSFNPFNVYITQPVVKPGCVLRPSNIRQLEERKLVDRSQVDECRRNMNTFAYVGELGDSPKVSCVYHSEEAENQYLNNPEKFMPFPDATVPEAVSDANGDSDAQSGNQ